MVEILIHPSQPRAETLQSEGREVPAGILANALIDTGASQTCVNNTILRQLEIPVRNVATIRTPSSPSHQCETYDVRLLFPGLNDGYTYQFPAIEVIACDFTTCDEDALIGMDILQNAIFIVNGHSSTFSLAF